MLARAACVAAALACVLAAAGACHRPAPPSARTGESDGGAPAPAPWFEDATDALGIDFDHDAGRTGEYYMPEVIGSGGAFLDADGDGRLDIYLVQNGGSASQSRNRLYRQGEDGRFTDVSASSGADLAGRGMGVAAGDVDNDGRVDLLVTELGRARLLLNTGACTFREITDASGIDNPAWGTSAAFFDYDRDGWLDAVIVNYVVYSATRPCTDQAGRRDYCGPAPFPGTVTRLLRNRGARGDSGARFEDVTVASGLAQVNGPGLGVVCADFDGDGWQDIFVANDARPNHLFMNRGDGTFSEDATLRGLALDGTGRALADMGIAIGDVDADGLFDLYVTHLTDELHTFWKQGPRGQFLDRTGSSGLARPRWRSTGFGTLFGDFDLDGDLDLAQVNGRVKFVDGPSPPGESFWRAYEERSQLFAGDGGGRFTDVSARNDAFCTPPCVARSLAAGDIDSDGALDLLVTVVDDRARVYRNVARRDGHWLLVRAVHPGWGGRDAYGAEITVTSADRRWVRHLQPGYSYLASNDPRVHFGLGSVERVDSLRVLWPDGVAETFSGSEVDRVLELRRGEGALEGRE